MQLCGSARLVVVAFRAALEMDHAARLRRLDSVFFGPIGLLLFFTLRWAIRRQFLAVFAFWQAMQGRPLTAI